MSRLRVPLSRPAALRGVALASLAANVVLVITGGLVRLTDSGLGCPTWPRCTSSSLVTTPAMGFHGAVEFGNRTFILLVEILAIACLVLALLQRPRRRDRVTWAALVFAMIPAQALMGGLTTLSGLNPWVVACHFLLSMVVLVVAYRLWRTSILPPGPSHPVLNQPLRLVTMLLTGVSAAVLAVGTVVTGSGPHAGDAHARRTGLDPGAVAQLHTDLVMLLVGLSVALWYALRAVGAPRRTQRAAGALLIAEAAQAVIGFVMYFTHVPSALVSPHMAGACAVWLATLVLLDSGWARDGAQPEPGPVTGSEPASADAERPGLPEPPAPAQPAAAGGSPARA